MTSDPVVLAENFRRSHTRCATCHGSKGVKSSVVNIPVKDKFTGKWEHFYEDGSYVSVCFDPEVAEMVAALLASEAARKSLETSNKALQDAHTIMHGWRDRAIERAEKAEARCTRMREAIAILLDGDLLDAATRESSAWADELTHRLQILRAALAADEETP